MLTIAAGLALLIWLAILLLPWGPWRVREVLEHEVGITAKQTAPPSFSAPSAGSDGTALPQFPGVEPGEGLTEITVLIPARNEAGVIAGTLTALGRQGGALRVVLVDDGSQDGTAQLAREAVRSAPQLALTVHRGEPLPEGWVGKLWALEQGLRLVTTRYVLLLDADIQLAPGVVSALFRQLQNRSCSFVSVMAELPMGNFWEKLLTPAFIYFFKMLYPFALANGPSKRFAAAAGGCVLVERHSLEQAGGLAAIRGALIDDCALAARLKSAGVRTWTGQSRYVRSARGYPTLRPIWMMVARSAYVQLRYSPLLLLLTTLGLLLLFVIPTAVLWAAEPTARLLACGAWLIMMLTYLPTLRFYRLSPCWALLMPLIGCLYLAMTWSSAVRFYLGVRSEWKGRQYRV